MGTVAELLTSMQQVDISAITVRVIEATGDKYLDINRSQMMEGKGRDRNIGRYSQSKLGRTYAKIKNNMNPDAGLGNVDLRLTGSFQDKMMLIVTGNDIEIDSTDEKAPDLLAKYGGQIYGLNSKNHPVYNETVFLPAFIDEIERITGLRLN